MTPQYDALLLVSFGGPEGPDDVIPFLENVLRGKNVPRQRMLEVADHYFHFGGVSPINAQNRALLAAIRADFAKAGLELPVFWGNRNWQPYLKDELAEMAAVGVRRALAFFTSAFSSYSGCRQYRENVEEARAAVGPTAPSVEKLRVYFDHPGFIEPMIESVGAHFASIPPQRRSATPLLFSAHSIPRSMADGCRYEQQLREACRLVAQGVQAAEWELVYQSRSGPPQQPWLEPDVGDRIRQLHAERGVRDVVVAPIGFTSDHMEVLYDLDYEARGLCDELGIELHRAATVGVHPRFVRMIRELVEERLDPAQPRLSLGELGPSHDVCPADCCLYSPSARPTPAAEASGGR